MNRDEPFEFSLNVSSTARPSMTEAEWLMSGDLKRHVERMWAEKRFRKIRLFSAACCRQLVPWMDEPALLEGIDRAERFADGELSESTIGKWRQKINHLGRARRGGRGSTWIPQMAVYHAVSSVCLESRYAGYADLWRTLVYHNAVYGEEFSRRGPGLAHSLLLDIFGNPFRPVAFDPAWRTSAAIALASQMYESRDFGNMPILADALQDAGCDSEEVVAHCRDPQQVHVRGCWVVDLVMGKA
jgi:hypothetical protein